MADYESENSPFPKVHPGFPWGPFRSLCWCNDICVELASPSFDTSGLISWVRARHVAHNDELEPLEMIGHFKALYTDFGD